MCRFFQVFQVFILSHSFQVPFQYMKKGEILRNSIRQFVFGSPFGFSFVQTPTNDDIHTDTYANVFKCSIATL